MLTRPAPPHTLAAGRKRFVETVAVIVNGGPVRRLWRHAGPPRPLRSTRKNCYRDEARVTRLALAVMLFAIAGCANDSAFTTPHPATGDFAGPVDIGEGRYLYLECHGQGGPIIVLESGYHDSSDPWNLTDAAAPAVGPAVMSTLARAHRACAYDRPGTLRYTEPPSVTERSSPVSMPRTAQDVVGDLHALLTAAGVPGPYVLVAHSLGGLFGRLYAQTYPDQVRALLFVDSFPVEIPTLMGADWPAYRQLLKPPRRPRSPGSKSPAAAWVSPDPMSQCGYRIGDADSRCVDWCARCCVRRIRHHTGRRLPRPSGYE